MVEVHRQGDQKSEENLGEESEFGRPGCTCLLSVWMGHFFLAELSHLAAEAENMDCSICAGLGIHCQKETESAVRI